MSSPIVSTKISAATITGGRDEGSSAGSSTVYDELLLQTAKKPFSSDIIINGDSSTYF